MNGTAYAFIGLTIIVAIMLAVLAYSVLRFASAARDARRSLGEARNEGVLLPSALEEAITRLKAQERATAARAEASERLSGQIVESLTSGLLVVDTHKRLQIVNPAARRILQLPDVATGADYREVLGRATTLADVIDEVLREHVPILRRTVTINVPDERAALGELRAAHLGVAVSPLAAEGAPTGAICLFTDLTSVVALEEQLRLKDSLARLGELTAGLAHEFRNGLATIHGYGRLLDPALLPEQYRPYVEGIRSETQALGEVVTNFLRFARPEPITLAPVDLRSLIARAAEDVPAAAVVLTGESPTIEGDDVLLRQAFSNLFRNSVEAAAPTEASPEVTVSVRVDHESKRVLLDLLDNGPGIPPQVLGQVFQPFFTTRAGGTGLGLAIVQKIVVSHNGLISATNRPEGGAAFRVTFPLSATTVDTIS